MKKKSVTVSYEEVMFGQPKSAGSYHPVETPISDHWNWDEVNRRLSKRTIWNYFQVTFSPWLTVTAPKGTECAMQNMLGDPLYRYKMYKDRAFCLEMEPSCGFPGS